MLGKLKEDRAYQNAMANSDAQNTKIEYDRALERAMVDLLAEGHTDLFKRFSDDPDFRERLDNHLETRAPREAGDTPAPPEPAQEPTATKTAEAKKAARRVTARAKRERERPAKLAARWAEPSEQSQSDLDKNLAKLRSIDESDFPTGEKDRIVALWEKAVAEADDDAPKTKREKRETVPRPDPTPDRATAEQIAHIKALYAVHPDSYGEVEGPPSTAAALVNEADTTMGQSEARDGIRRLTDVLKHHPPFGPPNDLRREEVQAAIEKLNELVEDPANRRLKEHYERLLKDDRRVREHLRLYFSQGPSSIKEISAGFKDLNLPQQARASKRHLEAKVEPEPAPVVEAEPAPAEEQAFMLPSFVTAQYRKPEEKPKREKPKGKAAPAP